MNFISRYDYSTGTFTLPPGGEGYYYFSTYILVPPGEWADFLMLLNGETHCNAVANHSGTDNGPAVCGGACYLREGL